MFVYPARSWECSGIRDEGRMERGLRAAPIRRAVSKYGDRYLVVGETAVHPGTAFSINGSTPMSAAPLAIVFVR
jgi:hypothetical protein